VSGVAAGVPPLNKLLIELVVEWNDSRELFRCQGARPKILRFLDPVVTNDSPGLGEKPGVRDGVALFCFLLSCSSLSRYWAVPLSRSVVLDTLAFGNFREALGSYHTVPVKILWLKNSGCFHTIGLWDVVLPVTTRLALQYNPSGLPAGDLKWG